MLSSEVRWFQEGYKKALKNAEKSNKVLMIDFYTDWCAVCQYMDKKIYNDDKFIEELTKLPIIPLKLNAERDEDGKVLSSSLK
ncbi:MAG: thioredoxin family protein [archaeon]